MNKKVKYMGGGGYFNPQIRRGVCLGAGLLLPVRFTTVLI